jgi:hypothetical protein
MQAFCCDVLRAFTNDGIAIAASKPMIATTIMISTNVKPVFLFIAFLLLGCGLRPCPINVTEDTLAGSVPTSQADSNRVVSISRKSFYSKENKILAMNVGLEG